MNEKIELFGDRVIVETINDTKSLIHVVNDVNKWRYKVVVVGGGRTSEFGKTMAPPVGVGDVVIVDPTRITNIEVNGQTVKLVESPDIIAKEK